MILWNGEEVGMHGSKGYVQKHVKDEDGNPLVEYDKISAYYNADYGPGKFRGIATQKAAHANKNSFPCFITISY